MDLPLPLGPTRPTSWPGSTEKETSVSTGRAGVVAERHVAELDAPADAVERPRVRRARQPLVGIEHGLDPLQADGRLRDVGARFRQILNRLEQLAEIGHEDDQRAGGHRAFEHQPGAEPEHRGGAERDQAGDHRAEQRPHAARVERRLDALDALRVEPLPLEGALRERLDHADGAEPFLHDGHDLALAPPHVARRLLDDAAQPEREDREQRRHRQRDDA